MAPPIEAGGPPKFDGRDALWSAEHLLLSSLSLCLMTTFEALAAKAQVRVRRYTCRAEATVDRTEARLGFTAFVLHIEVEVASEDAERARRLLTSAKRHCPVANGLRAPVTLEAVVLTSVAGAA
jgi:organic hydroperoxide reductase OsmC/OhrA